jgi:hypothetical protein
MLGSIISANTNIIGLQKYFPVYGRYIVPPGGVFGISAHFSLGTESGSQAHGMVWWHEANVGNFAGMGRPFY